MTYPTAFRRRPLFRLGVWLLKLDARLSGAKYEETVTKATP
jgi:hypothetical protein